MKTVRDSFYIVTAILCAAKPPTRRIDFISVVSPLIHSARGKMKYLVITERSCFIASQKDSLCNESLSRASCQDECYGMTKNRAGARDSMGARERNFPSKSTVEDGGGLFYCLT